MNKMKNFIKERGQVISENMYSDINWQFIIKNNESREFYVFKENEYIKLDMKSPVTFPILDGLFPGMTVDFEYIIIDEKNVVTKIYWPPVSRV